MMIVSSKPSFDIPMTRALVMLDPCPDVGWPCPVGAGAADCCATACCCTGWVLTTLQTISLTIISSDPTKLPADSGVWQFVTCGFWERAKDGVSTARTNKDKGLNFIISSLIE